MELNNDMRKALKQLQEAGFLVLDKRRSGEVRVVAPSGTHLGAYTSPARGSRETPKTLRQKVRQYERHLRADR